MKSSIFISSISLFLCFNLTAQIGLSNMSISEENAKYVYSGKKNLLFLNNIDAAKQYEVKVGELSLEKTDLAQFTYSAPFERQTKFDIYEDGNLINSEVFPIKRAGDSEVNIGNSTSKSLTVSEILLMPAFTLKSYDTYIEDEVINGYIMSIVGADGSVKKTFEPTKGPNFTSDQVEFIATLSSGDKLRINDFWLSDSAGVSRKKNQFDIAVK